MINGRSVGGKRSRIAQTISLIGVEARNGRERVRGRPSPAKVVTSTLIVRSSNTDVGGATRVEIIADGMASAVAIFENRLRDDICLTKR